MTIGGLVFLILLFNLDDFVDDGCLDHVSLCHIEASLGVVLDGVIYIVSIICFALFAPLATVDQILQVEPIVLIRVVLRLARVIDIKDGIPVQISAICPEIPKSI